MLIEKIESIENDHLLALFSEYLRRTQKTWGMAYTKWRKDNYLTHYKEVLTGERSGYSYLELTEQIPDWLYKSI